MRVLEAGFDGFKPSIVLAQAGLMVADLLALLVDDLGEHECFAGVDLVVRAKASIADMRRPKSSLLATRVSSVCWISRTDAWSLTTSTMTPSILASRRFSTPSRRFPTPSILASSLSCTVLSWAWVAGFAAGMARW